MISGFRGLSPLSVAKQAVKLFSAHNMSTYAGALTYTMLLAIFPFLIVILTLLGTFGLDSFFDTVLKEAQDTLSPELFSPFETILDQVRTGANGGLLSIGLLVAIWSAAGGVRSVMSALDVAYDVREERGLVRNYLASVMFTLGLGAVFIAALALLSFGPEAMQWLAGHIGLGDVFVAVWVWLRIPLTLLLMVVAIALIYSFFPNLDQPFRIVTPGSVIAVLGWILATVGFSVYLSNFGNYNATYGSLAGVIILLFYFYISSSILLFGAEVNAVIFKADIRTDKENVDSEAVAETRQQVGTSAPA